jgi:hypothetical protein
MKLLEFFRIGGTHSLKTTGEKMLQEFGYNEFMQKLTNAGYVDDKILRSNELWFYAPDNNTIMLPSWDSLRKIQPDESQEEIMQKYYDILFPDYLNLK